jgi:type III secretion protein V
MVQSTEVPDYACDAKDANGGILNTLDASRSEENHRRVMGKWLREPRGGTVTSLSLNDVNRLLRRYSDVGLASIVVLIVAMFVVPLPAFILDFLITLNIAASVVILLVGLHVSDALKIATFPSLLLLTTLFRVALEVSATRLILLKANAGHVIHAFGSFVAGGNLVVGVVVFVILTTVQLLVVAKGASRVAEVGARFTLDAMPGRQLAIDADVRAGHIDADEARRLRNHLARESQFFGAMDGAMKFVKGDAVAGIVVLLTNLVGGLLVGIMMKGMDSSAALRTYSLLTIGEGLVAQLPALLLSTAAGIVVTRVSPEEDGGHLGSDITRQIVAEPKALAIAAGLLGLLAAVPGLPAIPFLVLALFLGFLAYYLLARGPSRPHREGSRSVPAAPRGSVPSPLLIPLSVHLSHSLDQTGSRARLTTELIPALRESFFDETGIVLPPVVFRVDTALAEGSCVYCLHEIPVRAVKLPAEVPSAQAIADELVRFLRTDAYRLVGVEETQTLLDDLERTHPHLVRAVVPNVVSTIVLADILQGLAREGISLRYLADVLTALARHDRSDSPNPSTDMLAEEARVALGRAITHKHRRSDGTVGVYYLDPMIEEAVRDAIAHEGSGKTHLALEPDLANDIVQAVAAAVSGATCPVILTTREIRRHLRDLLQSASLPITVLAHQELSAEAKLQTLGHITIGGTTNP